MAMKGCSTLLKAPASLEPHLQIFLVLYPGHSLRVEVILLLCRGAVCVLYYIQPQLTGLKDAHWWRGLTPLQRGSWYILQPEQTGLRLVGIIYQDTHWAGVSYPSAEVQSVYSIAPADWARSSSFFFFFKFKFLMYITYFSYHASFFIEHISLKIFYILVSAKISSH